MVIDHESYRFRDGFVALVPARAGSKGLISKNLRLVGNESLVERSVKAGLKISRCQSVWCSTDSFEIAEHAAAVGAFLPPLRPFNLSTDTTPDIAVFLYCMNYQQKAFGFVTRYWIHLRPTTPHRRIEVIHQALETFEKKVSRITSLRSVNASPIFLNKLLHKGGNHLGRTWDGQADIDLANHPRQLSTQLFKPNGYVDIIKAEQVIIHNSFHGSRSYLFESPDAIDIDSLNDLNLANAFEQFSAINSES